jgi:hypothetical protein
MADEEPAAERRLREAFRLGDKMSGQIADHSLRLRRAKSAMKGAVYLLEIGRIRTAYEVLKAALAREPDE